MVDAAFSSGSRVGVQKEALRALCACRERRIFVCLGGGVFVEGFRCRNEFGMTMMDGLA